MKKKKKISTERIISVCAVILFFAAWYLVTALELVDPKLIPTPKATWDSFVEVLTQGYKGHTLLQHLGTSMERLLKAFQNQGICRTVYRILQTTAAAGVLHAADTGTRYR